MDMPINFTGGLNHCHVFYLRMVDCTRRESFFDLMCKNEIEDFVECKTRKRHRSFTVWKQTEMNKLKIISFPRFDDQTDSFVDGPLPNTADSFFDNADRMKEFFEIKPAVKKHEAESGGHHH